MISSGKWLMTHFGRSLLLLALLGGVFLFVHLGMVVPLQTEIDTKEAAWQAERPKISQLTLLKSAQQDLVLFRENLPKETALPELVSFISETAGSNRLSIPSISYQPEKVDVPGLMKVGIAFNVKGHYPDIRNFIYRLERSRHFLIIENLVLASAFKEGEAIQLQLRIAAYLREAGSDKSAHPAARGRSS
ncbi:MAG: type 4a pilus biogenesis protein PilO [Nitrospirae bacterium]|nr:type 4a pilus biogenesis protein PilO [Candidatus Manganitrophaceae bacterium]